MVYFAAFHYSDERQRLAVNDVWDTVEDSILQQYHRIQSDPRILWCKKI